ncbi:MAG: S41 family peptidase [Phycisphaerales bacterium]|nr:S41 family peptidase [Phycisphaerales bacterium]
MGLTLKKTLVVGLLGGVVGFAVLNQFAWAVRGADGGAAGEKAPPGKGEGRLSPQAFFDPMIEIEHQVSRTWFKEPDLRSMRTSAIRGMLDALDDPYTEFIPAEDLAEWDKNVLGEFVGIGAEVRSEGGWLMIASPLDDSPAFKAGIEAGDLVVAVDGKTTWQVPEQGVIRRLTGEPNTKVRVTIERAGSGSVKPAGALPPAEIGDDQKAPPAASGSVRFDLEIVRQKISVQTIRGLHREGEKWQYFADPGRKIAYVRLTQFTPTTDAELGEVLRGLVDQGMKGLVLDLRFNGGGSLAAALGVANLFIKEGVLISTRGRAVNEQRVLATGEGTLPDFPMVVLVNESSASASEVVSGALADNKRAVIVGTRTFGKGIVQQVYPLRSGAGQLKITEQYYYLPSGRSLHRMPDSTEWGVDPTAGFYVPMTASEYRETWRVRRDEEVLRRRENGSPGASAVDWGNAEAILAHLKDKQLSAGVRAVQGRIDSGGWNPTGEQAPKGVLAGAALRTEERRQEILMRELNRVQQRIAALSGAADANAAKPPELLPANKDLTGGRIQVFDKDGNPVATLTITGADLAQWLADAPLEKPKP